MIWMKINGQIFVLKIVIVYLATDVAHYIDKVLNTCRC